MNCKDCSSKCFELQSDSCVGYTGASFPSLGIEQGSSLQKTIEKLASALDSLKSRVDSCSFCNGETIVKSTDELVNTTNLSYSSVTEMPSDTRIKTEVTPGATSVPITYRVTELPPGEVITSNITIEGMRNGYPSQLLSTTGLSGGFELKPENFPAKMISKVRVITDSGEKEYTSTLPLDPSGQKVDVGMYVKQIGTPELNTQSQVNGFFDKELSSLKSAINGLKTINSSGTPMSVTEAIIQIDNRLRNLEKNG